MKTCKKVTVVIAVGLLAAFGFALRQQLMAISLPFEYEVHAKFDRMPETDDSLQEWISTQPGVTNCVIGRNNDEVRVYFVVVQNVGNTSPKCPDVESGFKKFGYAGNLRLEQSRSLYVR